jgi:hypothetical protein
MILHHVAQGSGRIVESTPALNAEIFYGCNLYVVDIVTVPYGLEDAIGKAESQNVLGCLLAKKMVDTEDLMLFEHRFIDFA